MSTSNIDIHARVFLRSDSITRACEGIVTEISKRLVVVKWSNNTIKKHAFSDLWAPDDLNRQNNKRRRTDEVLSTPTLSDPLNSLTLSSPPRIECR